MKKNLRSVAEIRSLKPMALNAKPILLGSSLYDFSLDRLALFGPERISFRLTRSAKMMVCDHKSFSVEEETQIFLPTRKA